jgi:SET domain-containing protein|tara:strand:+ start:500 stop:790 length:291 start_codon:yes stop_codon:yes gene_type:complete
MNYKPLPDSLTIKKSNIQGLGLFAVKNIAKNTDLGMIHFSYGELLIRTPLGGFINHSLKPNCKKLDLDQEWHLKTLIDIKKDEELTLKYTMYNPEL